MAPSPLYFTEEAEVWLKQFPVTSRLVTQGFESGPSMTPRRSTRRWPVPKRTCTTVMDTESDQTDVYIPLRSSVRGRGTPCSSRTGSNRSSRAAPLTRLTANALDILVEKSLC